MLRSTYAVVRAHAIFRFCRPPRSSEFRQAESGDLMGHPLRGEKRLIPGIGPSGRGQMQFQMHVAREQGAPVAERLL